jgi:hypothetical protein
MQKKKLLQGNILMFHFSLLRYTCSKSEAGVMTSVNFEKGFLSAQPTQQLIPNQQKYRDLTWSDLVNQNEYLSSITTVEDMMNRFEERASRMTKNTDLVCLIT